MPDVPLRADLHLHTHASDGSLSPWEMMHLAGAAGITVVAVTDHDTVSGVAEAKGAAKALGLALIPGLELTVGDAEEVHLLAYGVPPENPALLALLDAMMGRRRAHMAQILENLRALGMPLDAEEITAPDGRFMGRMNTARAMVKRGYAASVRDAFDRYLNPGRPAYAPANRLPITEGIAALSGLGALVSLAHPGRLAIPEDIWTARLPGWIEAGLSAIEAYHPSHPEGDALRYDRLARRHGLLVTGGSDCHGALPGHPAIGDHLRHWRTARADVAALQESIAQPKLG
ncbi:MAG: PHP domain-containing protein [Oscillospiraceae bacterium]|jgi:predicted metal-dependent phosphoesterase TrpH|nr:PHP domain-containing protein [Oscillospiraceae bacterium]